MVAMVVPPGADCTLDCPGLCRCWILQPLYLCSAVTNKAHVVVDEHKHAGVAATAQSRFAIFVECVGC